jgi:hypothetical protein
MLPPPGLTLDQPLASYVIGKVEPCQGWQHLQHGHSGALCGGEPGLAGGPCPHPSHSQPVPQRLPLPHLMMHAQPAVEHTGSGGYEPQRAPSHHTPGKASTNGSLSVEQQGHHAPSGCSLGSPSASGLEALDDEQQQQAQRVPRRTSAAALMTEESEQGSEEGEEEPSSSEEERPRKRRRPAAPKAKTAPVAGAKRRRRARPGAAAADGGSGGAAGRADRSSRFRGVTRHRRSGRFEVSLANVLPMQLARPLADSLGSPPPSLQAHIWVKELGRQVYLGERAMGSRLGTICPPSIAPARVLL